MTEAKRKRESIGEEDKQKKTEGKTERKRERERERERERKREGGREGEKEAEGEKKYTFQNYFIFFLLFNNINTPLL